MSERHDEIDAEFEHHLSASAEELARRGMAPADARAEAERRFGPRKTHHQRCLAQQPETTMRKTFTVAAIVALLAATAAAVDGWRRAFRSQAQIHQLRAENEFLAAVAIVPSNEPHDLPKLLPPGKPSEVHEPRESPMVRVPTAAEELATRQALQEAERESPRRATVMGAVKRGGLFATTEGETLRMLLDRAGGPLITDGRIQVMPDDKARPSAVVMTLDLRAFVRGEIDDVVLGERTIIHVDNGTGRGVIYVDGTIARPGVYQIPDNGRLTAGRLIAAAGGSEADTPIQVRVVRRETIDSVDGQREFLLSTRESETFALLPDDHVLIEARKTAAPE